MLVSVQILCRADVKMHDLELKVNNGNGPKNREAFTYDEAVELTGHGRYNYMALAACCIISNATALDIFGFSVVVTAASCDLHMGLTEIGLLASAPFAGWSHISENLMKNGGEQKSSTDISKSLAISVIGLVTGIIFAFPWGYYADTTGRRKSLLLSSSMGFVFGVLSSLATSWQVMLTLKLTGSVFATAAFALALTYLGECTSSKRRSQYLFIINSANLAAEIEFYSLAYFLLPLSFSVPIPWLGITYRPWRLYTLLLALPMGIGALMMLYLHESPKFLANKGDTKKALEVLRDIYEVNGGKKDYFPVKVLSTANIEISTDLSFWGSVVKQTVPLFKPPLLWRTLQLVYLFIICISTNNVFIMWYPKIVNHFFSSFAGEVIEDQSFCQRVVANITADVDAFDYACDDTISVNTIYSGIILGAVFGVLSLAVAVVASWRRLVLISMFLLSAICLLLVEVLRDLVASLVAFTLVQSTMIGVGSVAAYFVDFYPTSYRALATSLSIMFGRLSAMGGVNLVGVIITDHCSLTFYCWAAFVCSGIIVALFLPSERKTSVKY